MESKLDTSVADRPYLSLVLTGRNDNYGGDFRSRLQRCVSSAFKQLTDHGISAELIFVNYNPVADNPPIEKFIDWPVSTERVKVRIITIPNKIHLDLVADGTRKNVPVLEYLGKNTGIRRANGEFILSMNPDIILSSELVIGLKDLNRNNYYRADRIDFEGDLKAEYRLLTIYLKGHEYAMSDLKGMKALRKRNAGRNKWKLATPKWSPLLNLLSIPVYYNNVGNRYHCNVSGDFMMMHCSHWNSLCGHNEKAYIALHVDALIVVQAATLGLNEYTFQHPIFHQEHKRRYDANRPDPEFITAFEIFTRDSQEMQMRSKPKIYNDAYWGLSKFDLPEINP